MATGRPLWQGPIVGCAYLLAGLGLGGTAWSIGGWVPVPLWIIAALLVVVGAWTALFTGLWLVLAAAAARLSRRSSPSSD
jgi:hypothetical protein